MAVGKKAGSPFTCSRHILCGTADLQTRVCCQSIFSIYSVGLRSGCRPLFIDVQPARTAGVNPTASRLQSKAARRHESQQAVESESVESQHSAAGGRGCLDTFITPSPDKDPRAVQGGGITQAHVLGNRANSEP